MVVYDYPMKQGNFRGSAINLTGKSQFRLQQADNTRVVHWPVIGCVTILSLAIAVSLIRTFGAMHGNLHTLGRCLCPQLSKLLPSQALLLLLLLVPQRLPTRSLKKSATAYRLLAKTIAQLAQAQHVQAHPLLTIRATPGHWLKQAHAQQPNCQTAAWVPWKR